MAKKQEVETIEIVKNVIELHHWFVTIEGLGGCLMCKKADPVSPGEKKDQKKVDKAELEAMTWRDKLHYRPDIGVHFPSENIHEMLKAASRYWGMKIPGEGQKTYTNLVASGLIPEDMPLTSNGEPLLSREHTSIIQYGKWVNGNPTKPGTSVVWRIRPYISPWGGSVLFHTYDGRLTRDVIITLWSYAAQFGGLGDWRGNFGKFRLVSLEEVKDARFDATPAI